jgi:predicted Rossmann fold nucleotide-binding protein DprA/Smf involved in DNA uptake
MMDIQYLGNQELLKLQKTALYKVIPDELIAALHQGRLLIISTSKAVRQSKQTALERNRYICEMADKILFVGVTSNSSLYPLKDDYRTKLYGE